MVILLADRHALVRDALKAYLEGRDPSTMVVGVADLDAAIAAADRDSPDLVVLDLALLRARGPRRTLDAFGPVPVAVSCDEAPDTGELLEAGVRGILPRTLSGPAFAAALGLLLAGQRFAPFALPEPASPEGTGRPTGLTAREGEVLGMILEGRRNREIAHALGVAEVTVKLHVRNLFRKLGARNRTQVALLGRASAGT